MDYQLFGNTYSISQVSCHMSSGADKESIGVDHTIIDDEKKLCKCNNDNNQEDKHLLMSWVAGNNLTVKLIIQHLVILVVKHTIQ